MRKGIPFRVVIVPSGPKGAFVIAPGDVFSTMVKTWPACGLKPADGKKRPPPRLTLPDETSLPYSPTLVPLRRIARMPGAVEGRGRVLRLRFLTESVELGMMKPHPVKSPTKPSPLREGQVKVSISWIIVKLRFGCEPWT